jgi:hypothetical protein
MKALIFALVVAALTIAPIASAESSTPDAQAAALKTARAILKARGVRYPVSLGCQYETKSTRPESVPHGYAVTWCRLNLAGAYCHTPKGLPQYNTRIPTVAGFRYPPGFFDNGSVDTCYLEYITPTPYHGPEGIDFGGGGDSITIDGTTYSVPS